ncbi:MAG: sporulation protein YqfD [Muricoprocola sp.]
MVYFVRWLKGYVILWICGGNCERFLQLCANHSIQMWNLRVEGCRITFRLSVKDYFKVKDLRRKCGVHLVIHAKKGMPFLLHYGGKRKVFLTGLLFCVSMISLCSLYLWRIELTGNQQISRNMLLDFLASHQVTYGTLKSNIDCKELAEQIRTEFDLVTWVSVKLSGTQLTIALQENENYKNDQTELKAQEETMQGQDIISDVNGRVTSMIVKTGTPKVSVGDEIEEGQVLVSGCLENTDDYGNITGYQYVDSQAIIEVTYETLYQEEFPVVYETREETGRKRYGLEIELFEKSFGIQTFTDAYEISDVLSRDIPLKLFEDLYLPITFHVREQKEYKKMIRSMTQEEAEKAAKQHLLHFLMENEEKGVQISEKNVRIETGVSSCTCTAQLQVTRLCGKKVYTEKIDFQQEGHLE